MKNLGFVGTGLIGNPMARRLVRCGFHLKAHDRNPKALESVLAAGAEPVKEMAELTRTDAVLIVVNNREQVHEVVFGPDGLLLAGENDQGLPLLVVMSTISPEDIQAIARQLPSHSVRLLDAPISGGPFLAELGKLAVMVGGPADDFALAKPVFEALGEQVFHVGPLGTGVAMKLVNNVIGLASTLVVPEAIALGIRSGLDVERIVEVLNAGSGKTFLTENWQLIKSFLQTALQEGDPFGTRNALFTTGRKDLETAKQWAEGKGFATPMLDKLLEALSASGTEDLFDRVRTILGQGETGG